MGTRYASRGACYWPVTPESGARIRRLMSVYFHLVGLAVLLCSRMYFMSFRLRSAWDVKMPRAMMARSTLFSQRST